MSYEHGDAYEGDTNEIQAGYYKGRGVAGSEQFGLSKSGNEQVSLELELLDLGRRVTTILSFGGKGMGPSVERLKALGWDGNPNGLAGIDRNEVQVEIKYEEYEGKVRMRAEIKTRDGKFSFQSPMAEQQKRGFLAELSRVAAQVNGAGAPAAGAPRGPAPNGYPADWDKGGTQASQAARGTQAPAPRGRVNLG